MNLRRLIAASLSLSLLGCLGGPQSGDGDDDDTPGGGNPSDRQVVLAPNNGASGIRLINPSNNSQVTVIETQDVSPIATVTRRTRDAAGEFSDARSDFVVYEKDKKLLKVDLAASANATAGQQVSSETEVCQPGTLFQNDPDSALAMYVYTSEGTDGVCGTADDARRAVRLGMSATDTPLTLPSAESIVTDLTDGNGALAGWLLFNGTTLSRFDINFTNRSSVSGGAVVTTPDPPKTRDANGVLFQIGNELRYYNFNSNTLSNPIYTKPASAQFSQFRGDATRTYFTELDGGQTNIRALPTNGSAAAVLISQQSGNTANVLELTTSRVIFSAADGTIRSVGKDGTGGLNLRTPSTGATLSFDVVNDRVLITETAQRPTLFIYREDSNAPISQRSDTVFRGVTQRASGNLFGASRSRILAVRRLSNSNNDASGTLVSLNPQDAIEVTLGSLGASDATFVTQPLQTGDFSVGHTLNAGAGLQSLLTFNAATASSLRTIQ